MALEQASRTALMIAAYRARVSRGPAPLATDPWAEALAGDEGHKLARELDARFPSMELWVAVRTAYLDEHVRFWAGERGFGQVVLLGAGFDTRAARLARAGLRFFEVDHPATQAEKAARLERLVGYPKDAATRAPCDFEKDDFVESLARAGFRRDAPALVIWEGVTPYLPEVAIASTLGRIAGSLDARSVLVFDHLNKPKRQVDAHDYVEDLGEKVVWASNDPLPLLFQAGFRHVRSLSFDEACLTLTGTYERAREFRFQRMVTASVTPHQGHP